MQEFAYVEKISILVGFLLILSGIILFSLSYGIPPYLLLPYWFASALIIASGALFIAKFKDRKISVFVCGECNRKFLNEPDLRKHYAKEHVKKDSGEKSI